MMNYVEKMAQILKILKIIQIFEIAHGKLTEKL